MSVANRKDSPIHPAVKEALGFDRATEDSLIVSVVRTKIRQKCKPCWELKYCPYGSLVEQSPFLPIVQKEPSPQIDYFRNCLETGVLGDGTPLDKELRKYLEERVSGSDLNSNPTDIPEIIEELSCRVFGHICPVFFMAEDLTETTTSRRAGRYIPPAVKMRVARRDNYICQESGCGKVLRDFDIEFDHVIPVSKGGSSEEHNLRVTCFEHNRSKGEKVEL